MPKSQRLKIGDRVELVWLDICSFGRIDGGDDSELPLAEFVSYGRVSFADATRVVLLHECETNPISGSPTREPTVYPLGCITKVTILRPAGEAKL